MAIAISCIIVFVYYWITGSQRTGDWFQRRFSAGEAQIRKVLFNRLLGALLFSSVPLVILLGGFGQETTDFGLGTDNMGRSLLFWIPAAIIIPILSYFIAGSKSNLSQYPQIRKGDWDASLLVLSATSWIVYLLGYEILFRGFLLFSCYASFGFWPAIIINIIIYSLAHIPKGRRETLGSVPVGLLFCLVSLHLGSIWFALLTHITMALTNEWFSIYYHNEIRVK